MAETIFGNTCVLEYGENRICKVLFNSGLRKSEFALNSTAAISFSFLQSYMQTLSKSCHFLAYN